jgi:hypothetical protein
LRALAAAVLAIAALATPLGAQVLKTPSQQLGSLPEPFLEFAMRCLPTLTESKEQAWQRLDSDSFMLAYSPEQAAPFLGDLVGRAWGFRRQESAYVIVVGEDKTCMVFAAEAKTDGLLQSLDDLLNLVFPTVPREDIGSPIPDTAQTSSRVYALRLAGTPLVGATVTSDTQYNYAARIVLVQPRPPQG